MEYIVNNRHNIKAKKTEEVNTELFEENTN